MHWVLAKELNLKYFETSAVTGDGINKVFSLLSFDLMNKMESDKLNKNANTETNNNIHLTKEVNQEQNANNKKKSCKYFNILNKFYNY